MTFRPASRTLLALGVLLSSLAAPCAQADVAKDFDAAAKAHRRGEYATAMRLWKPLAEKGLVNAQFNLAQMYRYGDGIGADSGEALKWYRRAALQGDKEAQFNIGSMYMNGEGVARDEEEAHRWFTLNRHQHHHHHHSPQYQAWLGQARALLERDALQAAYAGNRDHGERIVAELRARAGLDGPLKVARLEDQ